MNTASYLCKYTKPAIVTATVVRMAPMTPTQRQSSSMTRHASEFVAATHGHLDALAHLLEHPGEDPAHTYTEMIRLVAQTRDTADLYALAMAKTGSQEPARVSLRRLAPALGQSVNTVRRRLDPEPATDPFTPGP